MKQSHLLLLLVLPSPAAAFLVPQRQSPPIGTSLDPKTSKKNTKNNNNVGVLQSLADFAATIGTVLTGIGTGVAMLTALEPKLRKKETVSWSKTATSMTLLATGEQLQLDPEFVMATPLWVAAAIAVFFAQQQQHQQEMQPTTSTTAAVTESVEELEMKLRTTVQDLKGQSAIDDDPLQQRPRIEMTDDTEEPTKNTSPETSTSTSNGGTTKTIRIKGGDGWRARLAAGAPVTTDNSSPGTSAGPSRLFLRQGAGDPMADPLGIGRYEESPEILSRSDSVLNRDKQIISIQGTSEEIIMSQLAVATMELARQTDVVTTQLSSSLPSQRMGKTSLKASNGSYYTTEYPASPWRSTTNTIDVSEDDDDDDDEVDDAPQWRQNRNGAVSPLANGASSSWRNGSTEYDQWISAQFATVTPDTIDVAIAKASGYLDRLNNAVNGLSELQLQQQPQQNQMNTMPKKVKKGNYAPTKPNVKEKTGLSSTYLDEMKHAASVLTSFVGAIAQESAQQQLQQGVSVPVKQSLSTEPIISAPKMTTVPPKKDTQQYQRDSYAPTKSDVKTKNGQANFYLQELQTSLEGMSTFVEEMAEVVAPKMTTIPKAVTHLPGKYAPTKPTVKQTNIDTRGPTTYLDELKYALSGLTSFAGTVEPLSPPETTQQEQSSDPAAPKMMTVPSKNTMFEPGAFAPTKPDVKKKSGRSPTYLEELNMLVSTLSSFVEQEVFLRSQEGTVTDDHDDIKVVAPKMATVPAKNKKFPKDAFAPTKPHVKDISSLTPTYLDQLKDSIFELISFAEGSPTTNAEFQLEELAPKMVTVPSTNKAFQYGAFATTKPNVKTKSGRSPTYLEALQSVVSTLSSFVDTVSVSEPPAADGVIPSTSESTYAPAPKMLTVPAKNSTKFTIGSFAPTKPKVKYMSALAPTYLDQLKTAVNGLSSFLDAVERPGNSGDESVSQLEEKLHAPPKMTTVPAPIKDVYDFNSFAPTKQSIKNFSSKGVGYLDQLKLAVGALSSFSSGPIKQVEQQPQANDAVAPKMTTVPAKAMHYRLNYFAPTKESVKNVSSKGMEYLDQLKHAAGSLTSFAGSPVQRTSTLSPDKLRPGFQDYIVEEKAPNTVPQPGSYLFALKNVANILSSMDSIEELADVLKSPAPKTVLVPRHETVEGQKKYHAYVEALNDAVSVLSSFVSEVSESLHEKEDSTKIIADKMTTVPGKENKFKGKSFAPTKATVKGVSSRSLAQASAYLETLKDAVVALSMDPEKHSVAPKMTTVPLRGHNPFTHDSFAPTRSSVKSLSSSSISEAGNYLAALKGVAETLASATSVEELSELLQAQAPKMVTVPGPRLTNQRSDFSPTKPSVIGVSVGRSPPIDSYLKSISDATSGLSTFVASVAESIEQDAKLIVEKMSTVPSKNKTFEGKSFAPTKSAVKGVSSRSIAQANNYLDTLKNAVNALSVTDPELLLIAPKMTTVPMKDHARFSRNSFAPTKPSVKDKSSVTLSQPGSYLDALKGIAESLANAVSAEELSELLQSPLPRRSESADINMMTVPMKDSNSFAGGQFAPTKSSVKYVSSRSETLPVSYLDQLKTVAMSLSAASSTKELSELLQAPAPIMMTVPGPKLPIRVSNFSATKSDVKNKLVGPSPPVDSYLKSLGEAVNGLHSFVDAVASSVEEATASPSAEKMSTVSVEQATASPSAEKMSTVSVEQATGSPSVEKMSTVPGKDNKFRGQNFSPTKPSVKAISSRSVAQANGYLETLKDAIAVLSSRNNSEKSYASTKSSIKDNSSSLVSPISNYLGDVADTLACATTVEDLTALLKSPAPKMTTVPGPHSPFRGSDFSATKASVKVVSQGPRLPLDSYLETLEDAASGLSSFVSSVSDTIERESVYNSVEKMSTVPGKENKFIGKSFAPTKPSVKGVSARSVSQAAAYLESMKDAILALSAAAAPIDVEALKMTTVPMRSANSFRQDSFAPTKSSIRGASSTSVSQVGNYLDALNRVADSLSSVESVEQLSELLHSPVSQVSLLSAAALSSDREPARMTTIPTKGTGLGPTAAQNSFAPTKASVKHMSPETISQAGKYLSALKTVSDALAGTRSDSELSELLRSPMPEKALTPAAPKMSTVPGRESPFRETNFAATKNTVKFTNGGASSSFSDSYLKTLSSAANALSSFVEAATSEIERIAVECELPKFQTVPQITRHHYSQSFAPTKASVKNIACGIPTVPSYLSELQNTVSALSSFVNVTTLIEASSDAVVQSVFTSVPRKGLVFRPGGYFPTKAVTARQTSVGSNTYLSALNQQGPSSSHTSFASAVANTKPVVSYQNVRPDFTTLSTEMPYVNGRPSVISPEAYVANESGLSLQNVKELVAELQEYKSSTAVAAKRLEQSQQNIDSSAYVLSSSVTTLSETVLSLSSCVKDLNRAVNHLVSFAEALNNSAMAGRGLTMERRTQ